jgi:hypothetical protein
MDLFSSKKSYLNIVYNDRNYPGTKIFDLFDTSLFDELRMVTEAEQLKNKLPPSMVKSPGTPLIVHKKRFLNFIGYKRRLFGWFLGY